MSEVILIFEKMEPKCVTRCQGESLFNLIVNFIPGVVSLVYGSLKPDVKMKMGTIDLHHSFES